MNKEQISAEFDAFFEFPTSDKSQVSSVSCKLFAKVIADMALSQSEPAQVSQPVYAYDVPIEGDAGSTELAYAAWYRRNPLPDNAIPLFTSPPDHEALKDRIAEWQRMYETNRETIEDLEKMYNGQCKCTDEWADKYEALAATISPDTITEQTALHAKTNARLIEANAENEKLQNRVAELNKVLDGLPQDSIDGGWTARGISKALKLAEAERDKLQLKCEGLCAGLRAIDKKLRLGHTLPDVSLFVGELLEQAK